MFKLSFICQTRVRSQRQYARREVHVDIKDRHVRWCPHSKHKTSHSNATSRNWLWLCQSTFCSAGKYVHTIFYSHIDSCVNMSYISANFTPWSALGGGLTLGMSATLYLLFTGRITGMSGNIDGVLKFDKASFHWKAVYTVRASIW